MKKTLLFILYLIPVALLFWFVATFSVNVPFWDQWRLAPLFDKVANGTASFGDFWALHSNHRIVFPKLIITALAFLSKWNINYEIYLSLLFALVTFWLLYKISWIQAKGRSNFLFHSTNILTCFLIFSLVQEQNWLWGFQLAWFLIDFCIILAIYWLNAEQKISAKTRICLAAICCFIASFSSFHGLLSWLALTPSLWVIEGNRNVKIKRLLIWVSLWVALCAVYVIDYHPQKGNPQLSSLLQQPFVAVNYFFSLLGSPLVRLPLVSATLGLVIFASFIAVIGYLFKSSQFKFEITISAAAPWLSIGLFSILCSLSITLGRVRYGVEQALESSRYTTTSLFLLIALIQLLQVVMRSIELNKWKKQIYGAGSVFLAATVMVNSGWVITQAQAALPYRQSMQTCLELINYLEKSPFHQSTDSCIWLLSSKTWLVRDGAEVLDRIGFRHLAKDITFLASSSKDYGYLDTPAATGKILTLKTSDRIRVGGWAILPDKLEPPNLVLLSYGNQTSFFANAYVILESPDVAKAFNSNRYHRVRWAVTFSANSLPLGETAIAAWVYNSESQQFVKLKGEAKVRVEKP
ncbi:MAG: hypothetical protein ACM37W_08070 [Actinomycetota bacterium]